MFDAYETPDERAWRVWQEEASRINADPESREQYESALCADWFWTRRGRCRDREAAVSDHVREAYEAGEVAR